MPVVLLVFRMRALSLDLRERIVAACDRGGHTRQQVAGLFGVSVFTVKKLLRQRRQTGSIASRYDRCTGRPRKILACHEERIRELLAARPDMTLGEICGELDLDCTPQAIDIALKRMGFTYKKNAAGQRARQA